MCFKVLNHLGKDIPKNFSIQRMIGVPMSPLIMNRTSLISKTKESSYINNSKVQR